jgi:RNA polymerase sigma-70 factor, ECF subfamily
MPKDNNHISPDEPLIKAIINNDTDSFRQLYLKYFPLLIRYALYHTHSMDLSRETVQELFSRIWIKRHLLNPQKSIKAYLYKSLHNIIINEKALHSSRNISLDEIKNTGSQEESNIELKIDIKAALDNMPEKIKTVYLLSRVEGFKYNEIAQICEISEKAVEKRMSKAINILRKQFL